MLHPKKSLNAYLNKIDICYGPQDLLTRFFLKIFNAGIERGVFLEFSTFDELLKINQLNLDSWRPITSSFRSDIGGASDDTGVVIVGRNIRGEIVATQAAKRLDWNGSNFKQEAESLRFFYADPERHRAPGEACIVTAPNATEITGNVVHSGGIWYHPSYRGRQLAELLPRLGRAYTYARWNIDHVCGVVSEANMQRRLAQRLGYSRITKLVTMRNSPGYPNTDVNLVLCHLSAIELIDDMFRFLVDFELQVDAAVNHRRAQ